MNKVDAGTQNQMRASLRNLVMTVNEKLQVELYHMK